MRKESRLGDDHDDRCLGGYGLYRTHQHTIFGKHSIRGTFWIRAAAPSMEFGEKSRWSPHFQPRSHSMTMQRDATGPEDGIGDNVARKQPFLALQGNLEGLTIRGLSPRASMLQHRDKVHVRLQVHPGPPGPRMGWALGQWASTVNSLPLGLGLGCLITVQYLTRETDGY